MSTVGAEEGAARDGLLRGTFKRHRAPGPAVSSYFILTEEESELKGNALDKPQN